MKTTLPKKLSSHRGFFEISIYWNFKTLFFILLSFGSNLLYSQTTSWVQLSSGTGVVASGVTRSAPWSWVPGGVPVSGTLSVTRTGAGVHRVFSETHAATITAGGYTASSYNSSTLSSKIGNVSGISHFGSVGELESGVNDVPSGSVSTTVIDFKLGKGMVLPKSTDFIFFDPGGSEGSLNGPFVYTFKAYLQGRPVSTAAWTVIVEDVYQTATSTGVKTSNYTWNPTTGVFNVSSFPIGIGATNFPDVITHINTNNSVFDQLVLTVEGLAVDTMGLGIGSSNAPETDSDGDGIIDSVDIDDDNDGITDITESGVAGVDPSADADADGIPNYKDPQFPGFVDVNGDGVNDNFDKDKDGVPNILDVDADNDGILDIYESLFYVANIDPDGDGRIGISTSPMPDADGDGLGDIMDPNTTAGAANIANSNYFGDRDGDGIRNQFDIDADNDGIVDNIEGQSTFGYKPPTGLDTDGDGLDDAYDVTQGATNIGYINTDGSSSPDYVDTDSENDGLSDLKENALGITGTLNPNEIDANNDGILDLSAYVDADNDGLADIFDLNLGSYGPTNVTNTQTPLSMNNTQVPGSGQRDWREKPDTDSDGVLNAVDLDADNDGIPNSVEGGETVDTDGDGIPNFLDLDSDNDGIYDVIEAGGSDPDNDGYPGTTPANPGGPLIATVNGQGVPTVSGTPIILTPIDTDGDGLPDYIDLDSDNDGIYDVIEAGGSDPNGDGIVGPAGFTDSDADGILDPVDRIDNYNSQTLPGVPYNLTNSDGTDLPNYRDPDSDNDGCPDAVEGGGAFNYTQVTTGELIGAVNTVGVPVIATGGQALGTSANAGAQDPACNLCNGTIYADNDKDGVADSCDQDDDNDGVIDTDESGVAGVDPSADADGDGIPNYNDPIPGGSIVFVDTDADGVNDNFDKDRDGIPNIFDLDSDNDGILDIWESLFYVANIDPDGDGRIGTGTTPPDADADGLADIMDPNTATGLANSTNASYFGDRDGDGLKNQFDIDADNDGIVDNIEGQSTLGYVPPTSLDYDQDGIDDAYDINNGGTPIGFVNHDGGSAPDYVDLDSENDGFFDLKENQVGASPSPTDIPSGVPLASGEIDANNDGLFDPAAFTDTDNDGLADVFDLVDNTANLPNNTTNSQTPTSMPNTQQPGSTERDWRDKTDADEDGVADGIDLDDDNDGIPDIVEGETDFDGDGIPNSKDLDADNDGIYDVIEGGGLDPDNNGFPGTGIPTVDAVTGVPTTGTLNLADTDGDGKPNFLDLDSDNDGIFDVIEAGGSDPNNDGFVGPPGFIDTDADGINDLVDNFDQRDKTSPFTTLPGIPLVLLDSNGDSTPNYISLDSDGDGCPDAVEGDGNLSYDNVQASGAIINPAIPPNVNTYGLPTEIISGQGLGSSTNAATQSPYCDLCNGTVYQDSDTDGIADTCDLDDDNDGITDLAESGGVDPGADADGDKIPNYLDPTFAGFVDSNADGVNDNFDADLDGTPNYVDLDSDQDGCLDAVEGSGNILETQLLAGRIIGTVSTTGIPTFTFDYL